MNNDSKTPFLNAIKNVIRSLFGYKKPRLFCFFMTFFLIYVLFLDRSKVSILIFTFMVLNALLTLFL
ncbi:MAG: hypothetical protein ACN23H_02275 [Candidatus Phytoplasma vitis]